MLASHLNRFSGKNQNMEERDNSMDPMSEMGTDEMGFDLNTDENVAGSAHMQEKMGGQEELDKLNAELQEQKDKFLRLYAEFDNFKRRSAKERIDLINTAGKEVIQSLLEVLDDLERAEKQMQQGSDINQIKEGQRLIFQKLKNTLQTRGLKEMESIGQEFDVDLHEAITEIPSPSPELKGKVIDQVEKGYFLNDKIIRFAKVVVGK
jgi:molecular chaperone GrpE